MLDAGRLIALDRGSARARGHLTTAERIGDVLHTTSPVAAQVWSDGSRQARLARMLRAMTVHPFLPDDVPVVGEALRRSGTADVVDAHIYAVAE